MKSLSVFCTSKLFSSRALFYSILIFTFLNCNYAYPANVEPRDVNPEEGNIGFDKFKQNHSITEIYFIYGTSLLSLQFGTLCTLYIMLRTFLRWKAGFSIGMAHKLPFYMAISGK